MKLLIDSFWRAAMYCLMPRVIGLSLLPLVLTVALSGFLGYMYWDAAVLMVQRWLEASSWLEGVWRWLEGVGFANLKTVVGPLLVIFSVTPLVVVVSLLAVSFLMTPALTRMVKGRRFPQMQRKQGASFFSSVVWFWARFCWLWARFCSLCLCGWCRLWPCCCRPWSGAG